MLSRFLKLGFHAFFLLSKTFVEFFLHFLKLLLEVPFLVLKFFDFLIDFIASLARGLLSRLDQLVDFFADVFKDFFYFFYGLISGSHGSSMNNLEIGVVSNKRSPRHYPGYALDGGGMINRKADKPSLCSSERSVPK